GARTRGDGAGGDPARHAGPPARGASDLEPRRARRGVHASPGPPPLHGGRRSAWRDRDDGAGAVPGARGGAVAQARSRAAGARRRRGTARRTACPVDEGVRTGAGAMGC
ncbi:hypothetical protein RZS08_35095, partial [Arthrospira platensis SPKY1]|nr:hypothetical protein [Arthrospira platensis SPKY1]